MGALLTVSLSIGAEPSSISDVSVSRPFFNPSLGQKIGVSFRVAGPGSLTVLVLDREGYVARKLVGEKAVEVGSLNLEWDGRDDSGVVVPDEAYSLKIDLTTDGRVESYFPATSAPEDLTVKTNYYDRRGAILAYKLPKPARVHAQAGSARVNPRTKQSEGPVLKTIVNREPRPAGAVVENWNGFDEGGTFYVPDLRDFVVAIAAESLPENAIITTGNRATSFLETAARRSGSSLLPPVGGGHEHHKGLTALEDVAPKLKAMPLNASWSARDRVWRPAGKKVRLSFSLTGPSAEAFQSLPAELIVFVDRSRVLEVAHPRSGGSAEVPLNRLSPGTHVVAVNWASAYGPVAVDALRIVVGEPSPPQPAAFKRGSP
jgi:flagellar hook assembly protein FlgD